MTTSPPSKGMPSKVREGGPGRMQKPGLLRRLSLLCIAIAVSLMLCELLARLVFPAPPYPYREPQILFVRDPQLGFFHQPSQVGWLDDGKATINSLGLRGREVDMPKPAAVYRIFVVGDSVTFGWGVNDDETFCQRLQHTLNDQRSVGRVEVINGGVSGYATDQEAALLARLAPRLQPDLVLVGFYWNDLLISDEPPPETSNHSTDGSTEIAAAPAHPGDVFTMSGSPSCWERWLRYSRAAYVAGRAIKRVRGSSESSWSMTSMEDDMLAGRQTEDIQKRWRLVAAELAKMRRSVARTASISASLSCLRVNRPVANFQRRNSIQNPRNC